MHVKRSSRSFRFEYLEARRLMAADLYLDFGANFALNSNQQAHVFTALPSTGANLLNAPITNDSVPTQLTSLLDGMVARNIDYDLNGSVNSLDADALAQEVVSLVSRIYEPFAVNVSIASSANISQVNSKLTQRTTNDAYILVGGRSEDDGVFGIARVDNGNTQDNAAFAYVEDLLDKAISMVNAGDHPWQFLASALARTTAHEAAHTFGLEHLLELDEGLTDDQLMLSASDIMDVEDDERHIFTSLVTRWNGLPTEDGPQNAFDVLAANVGLKANGPAYVTGTGANDTILVAGIGNNMALVTVSAFRDTDHTDLIATQSYQINIANGILVEGGRRSDRIEVLNVSVPVTLRGGQGQDDLVGTNGSDILEGDSGSDDLFGLGGSDTYLYRGPRFQDHGADDIDDTAGSDDVLDFSQLAFAVNVDLASTANHPIDYLPPTYMTFVWVPGTFGNQLKLVTVPYGSRLDLDLTSGSGSTGIENVRGTRFDDRIYGNELDNELFGNAGNDWLYGYDGLDTLSGGWGDDLLYGGAKRDMLYGQSGRDQLFGELGDDYLEGGYDGFTDLLNGGDGADEFVQYYRTVLTTGTFPNPAVVTSYQLVEGESIADFNSTKDKKVKKTVFPGFFTAFG